MMQEIVNSVSELASLIRSAPSSESATLVAIDGRNGAGKSTLASELTQILEFNYIKVDDYLNEDQGGYVEHLRYEEIVATLEKARHNCSLIIIEGVCLLELLARLNCTADILIYVKHLSPSGLWSDGITNFPPDKTAEEVIADHKRANALFSKMMGENNSIDEAPTLLDEIIRYHYKHKPHEMANVIYERAEKEA